MGDRRDRHVCNTHVVTVNVSVMQGQHARDPRAAGGLEAGGQDRVVSNTGHWCRCTISIIHAVGGPKGQGGWVRGRLDKAT